MGGADVGVDTRHLTINVQVRHGDNLERLNPENPSGDSWEIPDIAVFVQVWIELEDRKPIPSAFGPPQAKVQVCTIDTPGP